MLEIASINLSRSNFSVALFHLKSAMWPVIIDRKLIQRPRWRYRLLCLHCDIMNPCLSLWSEGEWVVSGCSL